MIATMHGGVLPGIPALEGRVEVAAIASRRIDQAVAVARRWRIEHAFGSLTQMLDDVELDAVVNLTPIPVHVETSMEILAAGRHLVTEKPMASSVAESDAMMALAADREVMIVASPPRMLDPARRLAADLIRSGAVGEVAFARIRSSHAGPAARAWPTDPSWFYAAGSGPLPDMGVYGLQDATGLLGPAISVSAASSRITPTRRVAGGAFAGTEIRVEEDDNVGVTLAFEHGRFAFVDCTFNVRASRSPAVEVFGLDGTIAIHDDGTRPAVEIYRVQANGVDGEWESAADDALDRDRARYRLLGRAVLLDDLVRSIDGGTEPELSAGHARHLIEIMAGARESARRGGVVALHTRC